MYVGENKVTLCRHGNKNVLKNKECEVKTIIIAGLN